MNILFVCTGNTCRSPLAVAAWNALEDKPQAQVSSAGIAARVGARAERFAIAVAREWNIDLKSHRARQMDENLMQNSDIVCAMTQAGADALREEFPLCAAKVRTLGEFSPLDAEKQKEIARLAQLLEVAPDDLQSRDIEDPFGGSLEEYQRCSGQIRRAVAGLAQALSRGEVAN